MTKEETHEGDNSRMIFPDHQSCPAHFVADNVKVKYRLK